MSDDARRALLLEELTSLRAELNATIDRMNANENFSAGAVSAIYAFVISNALTRFSLLLSGLALVIALFGATRYFRLQTHIRELDAYLRNAETEISPSGGWSTHFAKTLIGRRRLRFASTRFVFWIGLIAAAITGALMVAARVMA